MPFDWFQSISTALPTWLPPLDNPAPHVTLSTTVTVARNSQGLVFPPFHGRADNAETALQTVAFAAVFLRIRCLASPVQFINYNTSFCMQGMGMGRATMLHTVVRQLGLYIPLMFLMDRLFGATGLAATLAIRETLSAAFALFLLRMVTREKS